MNFLFKSNKCLISFETLEETCEINGSFSRKYILEMLKTLAGVSICSPFTLIPIYEIKFVIFISYRPSTCLNVRPGQCSIIVCHDMMF